MTFSFDIQTHSAQACASFNLSFSNYKLLCSGQWMIAQMVELLLCTLRTQVQIPAPAPYEITL